MGRLNVQTSGSSSPSIRCLEWFSQNASTASLVSNLHRGSHWSSDRQAGSNLVTSVWPVTQELQAGEHSLTQLA